MTIEFKSWGKTPRLFRDIVITEKIDGANSAVVIQESDGEVDENILYTVERDGKFYSVAAQSRNRLITPGKTTDNYGFADWVQVNAEALFDILGPGRHFGEWWGRGIQKRYPSTPIRGFALFNTAKHKGLHKWLPARDGSNVLIEPVYTFYEGPFSEDRIRATLEELKRSGSYMSPFDPAEGIVIFHTQSRQTYKVTLDGNDAGKWEAV